MLTIKKNTIKPKGVLFKDLRTGEFYTHSDGESPCIFIKKPHAFGGESFTSLDITDGMSTRTEKEDEVFPVDLEVVIKFK